MRKLKNSHKIISIFLLGTFFISLLILSDISNTLNTTQTQKSLTQDKIIPEQLSPIKDDNLPEPSAPYSAPIINQTFSIAQSEDDAFFRILPAPSGTFCDTTNITLGVADINGPSVYFTQGIGLRWDITVPKYATITKAYINLTIANLNFFGVPWTGFNTTIGAFKESSTNDFSNPSELFVIRPQTSQIPWELNGTEVSDQTIQTTNIADLLQQVMDLDGWDGIFGVSMLAAEGTEVNETVQFWAYDSGNPEYYPKLFIEWEGIPTFINTPEDKYIFENNSGHSLKWQIWDDHPDKVKITCDKTVPGIPYEEVWTSGWFIYKLPALKRGFYNFTAYFNDTDGHLIWDSVIVEAGPLKPIITSGIFKIDRSEDDAWYKPQKGSAFAESATILQLGGSTVIDNTAQRIICLRFNTAIPKHVRIKNAYVNLTVSSVSGPNNGLTSKIYLFYPPVADFTDDNDVFTLHPRWNETRPSNRNQPALGGFVKPVPLEWTLPGSLFSNDTIQTPNFTSYLQEVIDFPNFNGYIGLYIMPTAGVGFGEKINTYSYDNPKTAEEPQFTPTLFVDWEESPYFVETPADITAKNGIHGYHLDWTPADDNPTTFTITCNDTVSNIPPGSTIYSGVWQSGVETFYNWIYDGWERFNTETITTKIRYDLPPLEIGVYNFTIRINDADSWYNLDSVIVTVTDLDLPVIDLEFIQKGKEVDYFQCGNGPFTVRIYNSTSITPTAWLTAFYPGYVQYLYSTALPGGNTPIPALAIIEGDTDQTERFDAISNFPYNPVLGCYEFTCPSWGTYKWIIYKLQCLNINQKTTFFKIISDIEYNVLNRIEIRVNGEDEYIYNQTIYGGRWARPFEVWNKDLTPPIYSEPEFIEPDEPDKHYEVNIWASSEAYGAAVESAFLYYSIDDGPWEETEMVLKDGKYYAEIPAQEEGSTIDYYIKITDIAGNVIETEEYHERAPTFEEPSIIIPIVGILLGILGSLSIVAIYRHKNKAALKKLRSEKSPKLSKKGINIGNKLLQKIKKVRRKQ